MFELDFAEHRSAKKQGLSKDKRFLNIAETGMHTCDDGHYELPLPLKEGFKGLPNNRNNALRRELMKAFNEMDHEQIKSSLLKEQCVWITFKMNVPSASHVGGRVGTPDTNGTERALIPFTTQL